MRDLKVLCNPAHHYSHVTTAFPSRKVSTPAGHPRVTGPVPLPEPLLWAALIIFLLPSPFLSLLSTLILHCMFLINCS